MVLFKGKNNLVQFFVVVNVIEVRKKREIFLEERYNKNIICNSFLYKDELNYYYFWSYVQKKGILKVLNGIGKG